MGKTPELSRFEAMLDEKLQPTMPPSKMLLTSAQLANSYARGLNESTASMLPSHIYFLPSGREEGFYLAVDLGGSTLRVAIVHLEGYKDMSLRGGPIDQTHPRPMNIVEIRSWSGQSVDHLKNLTGDAFFDWIADKIGDVVEEKFGKRMTEQMLPLGLSWSFPIESTAIDRGKVQNMGKGYLVAEGLLGTDLKDHFQKAFERQGLNISMEAIVNDSLAALLSQAYVAPATRCALILGTGTNAAVSFPIGALPSSKTHHNPPPGAQEVLVNTELSMYGRDILPITKWDETLDANMPRPGFQPLEYLIGGGYLGEIARLIILDTQKEGDLFKDIPYIWESKSYSLPTKVLGTMEECDINQLPTNYKQLHHSFPDMRLPENDALALRAIAMNISSRAANYCAISVHALVKFRERFAKSPSSHPTAEVIPIAFVGTVMEKYPGLLKRTQEAFDRLTGWTPEPTQRNQRIVLEFSPESAIYGAAVAVAAALEKKSNPPVSPLSLGPPGPFTIPAPFVAPSPLNLPPNERSSNASTLVGRGSNIEDDTTPGSQKVPTVSGSRVQDPTLDNLDGTPERLEASQPKPDFWQKLKAFFEGVFGKVFKKRSKRP